MPQVKVSLNTTATPPVTLDPNTCPVNLGKDSVRWVQNSQSPIKGFTFYSLTGLPDPPFDTPTKNQNQTEISIGDDNTSPGEYPYTIVVSYNGAQYSSAASITGNGGPTIKNN